MPDNQARKQGGSPARDERGRFLPGQSGNPGGIGAGRPRKELNDLADEALELVLRHDLEVVSRAMAETLGPGERRPGKGETRDALDRLARVCGRRVTTRMEADVSSRGAEVPRNIPAEVLAVLARVAGAVPMEALTQDGGRGRPALAVLPPSAEAPSPSPVAEAMGDQRLRGPGATGRKLCSTGKTEGES
jgi:hypothetical protein